LSQINHEDKPLEGYLEGVIGLTELLRREEDVSLRKVRDV
jgi:hypothetical protein